jgi:hypothetical protein
MSLRKVCLLIEKKDLYLITEKRTMKLEQEAAAEQSVVVNYDFEV